ncbi:hypothetical protein Q5752_005235 [Cryptotrichosporon argae]
MALPTTAAAPTSSLPASTPSTFPFPFASHPRPHPSTLPHLTTDLGLLCALVARSKAQHRAQPFLRHAAEVKRLGARVVGETDAALRATDPASVGGVGGVGSGVGGSSSVNVTTVGETYDLTRLRLLVDKLVPALHRAAHASSLQIQLRHFVPLHLVLLAIYARAHAVALGIRAWVGVGVRPRPRGTARSGSGSGGVDVAGPSVKGTARRTTGSEGVDGVELGEKLDRADFAKLASARTGTPRALSRSTTQPSTASAVPAPNSLPIPATTTVSTAIALPTAPHAALPAPTRNNVAPDDPEPSVAAALPAPEPARLTAKPARPPARREEARKRTADGADGAKRRKKKKDAMDDIFGF